MINIKLRILRGLLEESIKNIDAGNSNHSADELDEIIKDLTKLNRGIKRISKREACEKILHCSPSTFDNYLKLGLIPPGHKEYGFKELSWSEKDFDEATLYRIKDYKDEILSILNPRFAKEKEQENKLNSLEGRVGNMEQGIDDIKTMLSKMLNK